MLKIIKNKEFPLTIVLFLAYFLLLSELRLNLIQFLSCYGMGAAFYYWGVRDGRDNK